MEQKKIQYADGRVKAEITVQQATVLQGMKRTRLMAEGQEQLRASLEGESVDFDRLLLRAYTYPDLIAASTEGRIESNGVELPWPPSFEAYLELPGRLGIQWERAVYTLNPDWLPEPESAEKKAPMTSTSD